MALDALLFDLDGTLVDSNSLHVEAFRRAFEEKGYRVAPDRIAIEIGKGGDHLVADVLGASADERDGEDLRDGWKRHFLHLLQEKPLRVLPGACELIDEARARSLRVALCTSATEDILEAVEKSSGVAWRELFDEVATSSDAKESKPSPDVVSATLEKLGLTPAGCALIGDTPHDAGACRAAGVVFLGLADQEHNMADLRDAGARAVYSSTKELCHHLDEALEIAAPGTLRWTPQIIDELMRAALGVAREGMDAGEAPIGSVLATGDGKIVARGFNAMNATGNKIAHAEIQTFVDAAGKVPLDARDLILVSTLEPCVMCSGACMEAGVDIVLFALAAPYDAGTHRVSAPRSPESRMPRFIGNVLVDESRALFEEWLENKRDTPQAAYVKQLLGEAPDSDGRE